jgi:hypothetical protein
MQYLGEYPSQENIAPEVWDCSIIKEIENKITGLLPQYDARQLAYFRLYSHSDASFAGGRSEDGGILMVGGVALCPQLILQVGTDTHLKKTALAHEIAHALQMCDAKLPLDNGVDYHHADWYREGIFQAIDKANE